MPQRRLVANGGSEQVPRGDMGEARRSGQDLGLRALAGAWGAEQHDYAADGGVPGSRRLMKPSSLRIISCASSCFIVSTTTLTTIRMLVPPMPTPTPALDRFLNIGSAAITAHGPTAMEATKMTSPATVILKCHAAQVLLSWRTRSDARDEAAVLAQVVRPSRRA